MALARTTKLQQRSAEAFGTGAFTTTAFTPDNDSLLVVAVRAQSDSNDGFTGASITMTPSAGSATARLNSTTSPGWSYGTRIWTIPITSGASMTVQVDAGAANIYQYVVEVYQYTGHNASPIGATASATDADGDAAGAATLSGVPATDSEVIAFSQVALNGPGTPGTDVGTGWTEIYDASTSEWSLDQTQIRTASTSTSVAWADLSTSGGITAGAVLLAIEIKAAGATAATLSAATPSGTLGTSTTATLGATTDQTTGTFYGVVDSSGNISGITATQIKAGQNNVGAAPVASSNAAVSTTSPTTAISGLTANTLYSYAVVQNNANGDSNVLTGTFTTAAAVTGSNRFMLLGVG